MARIFLRAGCLGCPTSPNTLLLFKNTSKIPKTLRFGFWTTKICLQWFGQKKIYKRVGLLRRFFGLKFNLPILGWLEQPIPFFGVFLLPAPTLLMTKCLLTFAGSKNAQNNYFFRYTKTGSDLKIFDLWKIHSEGPVSNRKKSSVWYFSCTHRYKATWGLN